MYFLTSCESPKEEKEDFKLLVTTPLLKDTTVTKEYVSQIHSIQHIELRALERGYVEKIFQDEGKLVPKGAMMFQIMPLIYRAEMQKAKAEANFALIEYKNTKRLTDSGIVSENELAMAQAKLDKANAELSLSQVHLGFTEVRAPFEGIMDKFNVRLGSLLEEGDLLTTISDNSKMWVYFNVPEAEYLDYQSKPHGEKVNVRLKMANNELFKYPGIIETLEADFNNETGNIAFRATFPNPDRLLRHGETGTILLNSTVKKAIIIPQKATFEILEKKFVYVVDKNNIVHAREINIQAEMPDIYILKNGIQPGEKILLEGLKKVSEGDKIRFDFVTPEKVLSELNVYSE
jgi:membrane fusion protein (multidrug efflux system)